MPSGADGNYTYSWQESVDNQQWTNIPQTDSITYQPPILNESRYYRTLVSSDFGCGTVETSSIMVNVYDEFITGSISLTDTICYNTDANIINTINSPSGGHTPYSMFGVILRILLIGLISLEIMRHHIILHY